MDDLPDLPIPEKATMLESWQGDLCHKGKSIARVSVMGGIKLPVDMPNELEVHQKVKFTEFTSKVVTEDTALTFSEMTFVEEHGLMVSVFQPISESSVMNNFLSFLNKSKSVAVSVIEENNSVVFFIPSKLAPAGMFPDVPKDTDITHNDVMFGVFKLGPKYMPIKEETNGEPVEEKRNEETTSDEKTTKPAQEPENEHETTQQQNDIPKGILKKSGAQANSKPNLPNRQNSSETKDKSNKSQAKRSESEEIDPTQKPVTKTKGSKSAGKKLSLGEYRTRKGLNKQKPEVAFNDNPSCPSAPEVNANGDMQEHKTESSIGKDMETNGDSNQTESSLTDNKQKPKSVKKRTPKQSKKVDDILDEGTSTTKDAKSGTNKSKGKPKSKQTQNQQTIESPKTLPENENPNENETNDNVPADTHLPSIDKDHSDHEEMPVLEKVPPLKISKQRGRPKSRKSRESSDSTKSNSSTKSSKEKKDMGSAGTNKPLSNISEEQCECSENERKTEKESSPNKDIASSRIEDLKDNEIRAHSDETRFEDNETRAASAQSETSTNLGVVTDVRSEHIIKQEHMDTQENTCASSDTSQNTQGMATETKQNADVNTLNTQSASMDTQENATSSNETHDNLKNIHIYPRTITVAPLGDAEHELPNLDPSVRVKSEPSQQTEKTGVQINDNISEFQNGSEPNLKLNVSVSNTTINSMLQQKSYVNDNGKTTSKMKVTSHIPDKSKPEENVNEIVNAERTPPALSTNSPMNGRNHAPDNVLANQITSSDIRSTAEIDSHNIPNSNQMTQMNSSNQIVTNHVIPATSTISSNSVNHIEKSASIFPDHPIIDFAATNQLIDDVFDNNAESSSSDHEIDISIPIRKEVMEFEPAAYYDILANIDALRASLIQMKAATKERAKCVELIDQISEKLVVKRKHNVSVYKHAGTNTKRQMFESSNRNELNDSIPIRVLNFDGTRCESSINTLGDNIAKPYQPLNSGVSQNSAIHSQSDVNSTSSVYNSVQSRTPTMQQLQHNQIQTHEESIPMTDIGRRDRMTNVPQNFRQSRDSGLGTDDSSPRSSNTFSESPVRTFSSDATLQSQQINAVNQTSVRYDTSQNQPAINVHKPLNTSFEQHQTTTANEFINNIIIANSANSGNFVSPNDLMPSPTKHNEAFITDSNRTTSDFRSRIPTNQNAPDFPPLPANQQRRSRSSSSDSISSIFAANTASRDKDERRASRENRSRSKDGHSRERRSSERKTKRSSRLRDDATRRRGIGDKGVWLNGRYDHKKRFGNRFAKPFFNKGFHSRYGSRDHFRKSTKDWKTTENRFSSAASKRNRSSEPLKDIDERKRRRRESPVVPVVNVKEVDPNIEAVKKRPLSVAAMLSQIRQDFVSDNTNDNKAISESNSVEDKVEKAEHKREKKSRKSKKDKKDKKRRSSPSSRKRSHKQCKRSRNSSESPERLSRKRRSRSRSSRSSRRSDNQSKMAACEDPANIPLPAENSTNMGGGPRIMHSPLHVDIPKDSGDKMESLSDETVRRNMRRSESDGKDDLLATAVRDGVVYRTDFGSKWDSTDEYEIGSDSPNKDNTKLPPKSPASPSNMEARNSLDRLSIDYANEENSYSVSGSGLYNNNRDLSPPRPNGFDTRPPNVPTQRDDLSPRAFTPPPRDFDRRGVRPYSPPPRGDEWVARNRALSPPFQRGDFPPAPRRISTSPRREFSPVRRSFSPPRRDPSPPPQRGFSPPPRRNFSPSPQRREFSPPPGNRRNFSPSPQRRRVSSPQLAIGRNVFCSPPAQGRRNSSPSPQGRRGFSPPPAQVRRGFSPSPQGRREFSPPPPTQTRRDLSPPPPQQSGARDFRHRSRSPPAPHDHEGSPWRRTSPSRDLRSPPFPLRDGGDRMSFGSPPPPGASAANQMFKQWSDSKYISHLSLVVKKMLFSPDKSLHPFINKIYACAKTIGRRLNNQQNPVNEARRRLETADDLGVEEAKSLRDQIAQQSENRKKFEMYSIVFHFLRCKVDVEATLRRKTSDDQMDRNRFLSELCKGLEEKLDILRECKVDLLEQLKMKHQFSEEKIINAALDHCREMIDDIRKDVKGMRKEIGR